MKSDRRGFRDHRKAKAISTKGGPPATDDLGFYIQREVREITRKSDPTIWRWEKKGIFPKSVRLGPNSKGTDRCPEYRVATGSRSPLPNLEWRWKEFQQENGCRDTLQNGRETV